MSDSYRIQLPQFEGPFDLLLFFIERDELDIHDIPIAKITNDFLDYIHEMQVMNIELASEFILVAATLMRIKSRMLLPRPVIDEATGEEIDPREELVQRLLEYKRYKEVLGQLSELEEAQAERHTRGYAKAEEKLFLKADYPEEELHGIDLYTLMRAFRRIMDRHQAELRKPRHVIRRYPYNIEEVKAGILQQIQQKDRIDFLTLILEESDPIYAVFCFLGILELVQVQRVKLTVGEGFNNFWMAKKDENPPSEPLEGDIPKNTD
jgi:segregation and condensation protein A